MRTSMWKLIKVWEEETCPMSPFWSFIQLCNNVWRKVQKKIKCNKWCISAKWICIYSSIGYALRLFCIDWHRIWRESIVDISDYGNIGGPIIFKCEQPLWFWASPCISKSYSIVWHQILEEGTTLSIVCFHFIF